MIKFSFLRQHWVIQSDAVRVELGDIDLSEGGASESEVNRTNVLGDTDSLGAPASLSRKRFPKVPRYHSHGAARPRYRPVVPRQNLKPGR